MRGGTFILIIIVITFFNDRFHVFEELVDLFWFTLGDVKKRKRRGKFMVASREERAKLLLNVTA